VFIGGIAENFESSYRIGGGREFVIEGDEYDSAFFDKTAKFLKYLPDIAVVNNVEFDHADIYADLAAIRLAFQRFVNLVPRRGLLLLGADNAEAMALRERAKCRVETFGLSDGADWQAHDLRVTGTSTTFSVRRNGTPVGQFELSLLGAYNVRNALAAIAVGATVGLHTDTLAEGLRRFKGVRRRMELRGTAAGVSVYDDFAHHPTAIEETLAGVRTAFPNQRVWAIFEPRSATSCRRIFQSDFARALSGADTVVLPAVFRSNLPEEQRLSVEQLIGDLQAANVDARYIPEVGDIVETVARESRDGDLVVVMSNGGFDGIHEKLLQALDARSRRR
jgi:UDP-N-acetylmuramate: L-alanyl-gamma-D-glutamyl-meso-diaminopimelate ligase